jgi:hypothetical protein
LKPREEADLSQYRSNIYKSWQIMHQVVRQIDQESYIAHLEPNPGVGYDCLSLLTRNSHGDLKASFMLNRNGVNAFGARQTIEDVWDRASSDDEIQAIANQLIDDAQLARNSGKDSTSKMEAISRFVVSWINEHQDQEFCVSPPHWPEGCALLSSEIDYKYDEKKWPVIGQLPLLILGVNNREEVRLDMSDNSKTPTQEAQ